MCDSAAAARSHYSCRAMFLMHGQQLNKQSRHHRTGMWALCSWVRCHGAAGRVDKGFRRDDRLAGCDIRITGARRVLFRRGIQPLFVPRGDKERRGKSWTSTNCVPLSPATHLPGSSGRGNHTGLWLIGGCGARGALSVWRRYVRVLLCQAGQ